MNHVFGSGSTWIVRELEAADILKINISAGSSF